jgi:hypothetical protein
MRSASTGRVVPKTCKSWLCPNCNVWLREGARRAIAFGMFHRPAGYDLGFFTFTEPAQATLDLPAFYSRMQKTVQRLRYRGWIGEYATSVEFQDRGALHPHVIAHVPLELVPKLRPFGAEKRNREQYGWWVKELRPMAVDLGWGAVADAVAVATMTETSHYVTKSLAGYATKEAHRKFKAAGARRVRPVRFSKGWHGRHLRDYQRGDKATDNGPWEDISTMGPCVA